MPMAYLDVDVTWTALINLYAKGGRVMVAPRLPIEDVWLH